MNGNEVLLDTNVCIYFLNGDQVLIDFLQDQTVYISIITEIELYAFHGHDEVSISILNEFIESVIVLNIHKEVKNSSIELRKTYKLKVPDTIVAASALAFSLPMLTADKAFKKIENLDLIFYNKGTQLTE